MSYELDWNIAVYCQNEEKRLQGCLERVVAALTGRRALITVILNGSRDRSLDIARAVAMAEAPIEIFQIGSGDKSNAINQFIYALRSPARLYGAVDGYAYIASASFRAMEERLEADPHAVAVTGICSNGRTMNLATQNTLTVGGQLHGQLHAFRSDFYDRMVARHIKLPVGTYWGDGLLGSMAAHDLDALSQPWENSRIAGVAAATYEIPMLSPFRFDDVRRQLRRKVRQMRGQIQNAAISELSTVRAMRVYRTMPTKWSRASLPTMLRQRLDGQIGSSACWQSARLGVHPSGSRLVSCLIACR